MTKEQADVLEIQIAERISKLAEDELLAALPEYSQKVYRQEAAEIIAIVLEVK